MESKKSGAGATKHKKYIYGDQLLFLKKLYVERAVEENFENNKENDNPDVNVDIDVDVDVDVDDTQTTESLTEDAIRSTQATSCRSTAQNSGSSSRKRRKPDALELRMLQVLENEKPNRHLSFFHGIIPALEKFDESEILKFQMGVLQLMSKINEDKQRHSYSLFPPQHGINPSQPTSSSFQHTQQYSSHQGHPTTGQYFQNFTQPFTFNTALPNRPSESPSPAQSTSSYISVDFSPFSPNPGNQNI